MSNKLEKLDLSKLPSILFCAAYWKVDKFSKPSSSEERTRQLLHPGSCSPLPSLLTLAQTDIPTQIQISSIWNKSALRNLGVI